jgi:predicted RNase H-like HicB family nuclease
MGDVRAVNSPIRPSSCVTIVYRKDAGMQARMSMLLDDLAPSPWVLVRSIPVDVQKEDDIYLASFLDANINASGETPSDAVDMLKDMIASTFRLLSKKEPVLGEGPQRQLAVLRQFVTVQDRWAETLLLSK